MCLCVWTGDWPLRQWPRRLLKMVIILQPATMWRWSAMKTKSVGELMTFEGFAFDLIFVSRKNWFSLLNDSMGNHIWLVTTNLAEWTPQTRHGRPTNVDYVPRNRFHKRFARVFFSFTFPHIRSIFVEINTHSKRAEFMSHSIKQIEPNQIRLITLGDTRSNSIIKLSARLLVWWILDRCKAIFFVYRSLTRVELIRFSIN